MLIRANNPQALALRVDADGSDTEDRQREMHAK